MDKENMSKLFDSAVSEDYVDFKEVFKTVFVEEFNRQCSELEKEVTKELARFDVVSEGISIPLNNPKIKDAHLFAIESDEDNMVVKFKVDGKDIDYKVPTEKQEFYKAIEEKSELDEDEKEKVAMDLNELMDDIKVDKKDESIERGEEIAKKDVKMEEDKMASADKETRLKLLKKLGEKMQNEKSKQMNKSTNEELTLEYEVDVTKPVFKIKGKNPNGNPFTTAGGSNNKADLKEHMDKLKEKGFKELEIVKVNMK